MRFTYKIEDMGEIGGFHAKVLRADGRWHRARGRIVGDGSGSAHVVACDTREQAVAAARQLARRLHASGELAVEAD